MQWASCCKDKLQRDACNGQAAARQAAARQAAKARMQWAERKSMHAMGNMLFNAIQF
jgi:hypothetical protein